MSTPRKARQQPDVREAEARYRSLFEQVPIGLFRTTPDGRILDANSTLYRMLGCATLEEFLATNAGDYYVNAEDRRRCREILERDGIVRDFEAEFRTRTGTALWVALSESVVRDEQGRVRFYEGAMKDVTERKRAEAELAASEIRLRTIVQAEPECVKVIAADGTLLEMNPAGLAMLEADSAEQVVGKNLFGCVAPEHREAFRTLTQRVCRGEEGTLEFEVIGLKGTRRWLETRAAPLRDERGAIFAALGVSRDVTDRRRAEAVRSATYRIAEATNTAGSLADLLATIHRIVGEVMPARNLFVALLDPAGATISFPYFADELDPAPPAPTMKIGNHRTLTEYVLRTGRPLLATHEVFNEMVQRGDVAEVGAPSIDWVGVPLKAEDRTIGVLAVQSYSEGVRYGERDVEILRFVSTQVAQAIARKQAEEERGASERRLRTVIESAPIVLWAFDKDGVFTLSEGSGLKALGLRPGQVVGRSVFDVYEDFPGIVADARRALAGESLTTVAEVGGLAFDVRYTPVRDERGAVSAVVGVGTDITARRASETSLRETLSLLSATLESTADGILVVDHDGKVASYNRRFAELWRIPEELLATRDDDRLIGFVLNQLADPDAFVAKVRQVYDDPSAESFDSLEFKDGRRFERYSKARLIGGEVVGRVWSFRDVTERASLERQLRQATKMEAVGLLAGGVAHDFNNLLTVITGYSDLLLSDLAPEDPRREDVGEIRKAADRAAALTRQLLAFSRRQVLQPKVLDLNAVVRSADKLLRRVIGENVDVVLRLDPELAAVRADANQLEQVIVNLAVNARDAMPDGGTLTIETASADLQPSFTAEHSILAGGRFVQLTVRDTGHGMDAEVRPRIFDPFFTTKEKGKGTGLGLATVYGIVKQSGGFIWVESEPGKGATFRVCLPPVDEPVALVAVEASAGAALRGTEVVLVAEDEDAVRAVARRALQRLGYTVLEASDGPAALRVAAGHEGAIGLLLTDVVMPGMSGKELADALTAQRPNTRVLFMSGYTDDAIVREGMLEPGLAFLPKPFTAERLAEMVREVLDRQ